MLIVSSLLEWSTYCVTFTVLFVSKFIDWSCFVGQLLTEQIIALITFVAYLGRGCASLFLILREDFSLFVLDITGTLLTALLGLKTVVNCVLSWFLDGCNLLLTIISETLAIIYNIIHSIFAVFNGVFYGVVLIHNGIKFIGASTISACIFLPRELANIIVRAVSEISSILKNSPLYLHQAFSHVINALHDAFFIDVYTAPGLLVGFAICFIIITKFRVILAATGDLARTIIEKLCSTLNDCWTGELFRRSGQAFEYATVDNRLQERNFDVETENIKEESQLCVVCLERPKNVVILPCRHVCVCVGCSQQIGTLCPLCRKRIRKTLQVYV